MDIDYSIFLLVSIISILIIILFMNYKNDKLYKFIVLGLGLSTFIYSGLGISYKSIDNFFIFPYITYLVTFLGTFAIIYKNEHISNHKSIIITFGEKRINKFLVKVFTLIYFLTKLTYLIFPTNRLINLIIPPSVNVFNVRYLEQAFNANSILNIASLVSIITFPFFMIYLNGLIRSNNKVNVLFLTLYWIYIDFAIYEYISRSEIIVKLLFLYLILHSDGSQLKIRKKEITFMLLAFILSIPLLVSYATYRLYGDFAINSFFGAFESLLSSEISYPRFYDLLFNNKSTYGIGNYLLWIATLPIPKSIIPVNIITFNVFFTNLINPFLDYIVLPSILGEAFMIFGNVYFIVHGIFLGTIIGLTVRILSKYNFSNVLLIYFGVLTFSIGRGGSMEIISFAINNIFIIWVGLLISYFIKKNKNKTGGLE